MRLSNEATRRKFYSADRLWGVASLILAEIQEHMKWAKLTLLCTLAGIAVILAGCQGNVAGPQFSSGNYQICYCGYGQIEINNIMGTDPVDLSLQDPNFKSGDYDDNPRWSPDGRYIAFRRLRPDTSYNPFIYVYDTQKKTFTNLTSDGGLASSNPQWTQDGKVYFSYESPVLSATATYLMNPDGSDKRKILDDSTASIYFYQDSYTFLYVDGTEVYKTNLDGTFNDPVFQLPPPGASQYLTIQDFNPMTGKLLANTNMVAGTASAIVTINPETRQLDTVVTADPGWTVALPQYSSDYSMIAFIEYDSTHDEYLSIFKSGSKCRLIHVSGDTAAGYRQFAWYPPRFSADSKYLAYDELVYGSSTWVNFQQYLYVIDVTTRNAQYVDKGFDVSWNPKP